MTTASLQPGGEPVPGYRLTRRLGQGGFGEVWAAVAPGGVPVALKFVPLGGPAGRAELRSLDLLRAIRHPNLLGISAAWQQPDRLVLALELADRSLLDRYHQATSQGLLGIPRGELLGYLAEAARGLDYLNAPLHRLDGGEPVRVQHRDVKPANILLVGGGVKVADFGLARALAGVVTGHTGSLTLAFAAPEFFRGETAQNSDQYSLAATYCLLRGGSPPFAGTAEQIMAGHLTRQPELAMLPAEERPAVQRALAKDPARRWPSCRALVEALAACPPATEAPGPTGTPGPLSFSPSELAPTGGWPQSAASERGWTLPLEDTGSVQAAGASAGELSPPAPVQAAPSRPVPWGKAALLILAVWLISLVLVLVLRRPGTPDKEGATPPIDSTWSTGTSGKGITKEPGGKPAAAVLSPEAVQRAWENAGAEVGRMRENWERSNLEFQARAKASFGGLLAFRLKRWRAGDLAKLPPPLEPFGLDIPFTEAGMKELTRFEQLRMLKMESGSVTATGLRELAALPHLESLGLCSALHKDFKEALTEVARLPQLQSLNIYNCTALTNKDLEPLKGAKRLRRFGLGPSTGIGVTREGLASLSRAVPGLVINFYNSQPIFGY